MNCDVERQRWRSSQMSSTLSFVRLWSESSCSSFCPIRSIHSLIGMDGNSAVVSKEMKMSSELRVIFLKRLAISAEFFTLCRQVALRGFRMRMSSLARGSWGHPMWLTTLRPGYPFWGLCALIAVQAVGGLGSEVFVINSTTCVMPLNHHEMVMENEISGKNSQKT